MKKGLMGKSLLIVFIILVVFVAACGKKDEPARAPGTTEQVQQSAPAASVNTVPSEPVIGPEFKGAQATPPKDVIVSVNGNVLKKDVLEKKVKEAMNLFKSKIPEEKKKEIYNGVRKKIIDDFVIRTVLFGEVNNKKITASDKEIQDELKMIKANIPPDKTVDAFLKENGITKDDLAFGIKIKKLVEKDTGKKTKPTEKEIKEFYTANMDKFTQSESVHVRQVLVTVSAKDDEKTKNEKKAKIEELRKQILEGADFAEIARKNSDCPSKESGGDLGDIKKGQSTKPFEDAAFSQEVNAIGPVVTTEFGYHVIQVLAKKPAKTTKLEEVRDKISMYLEQNKQREAFGKLVDRLRKNAVIMYYEN